MTTKAPTDHKSTQRLQPGTTVLDREQLAGFPNLPHDTPSVGIVIAQDGTTADRFETDEGLTVAEDNPQYPATDPVIQVVWHAQLDAIATLWGGWSAEEIYGVVHARSDVTVYHFPASRLVTPAEAADVETYSAAIEALGK